IVAVPPAPSGRLRKAQKPPARSASPISAPPWSMPPAVHLSSLQASRARTSCGEADTISAPRNAVYGAAAATWPVSSGSAGSTRGGYPPGVSSELASASALERTWWLRAPAVLVAPHAVFVSLRDESDEEREARQEPITAIAGLAGIAAVLASPVARHLLNDPSVSLDIVPVWAFLGGAVYALALYWVGGGLLFGASRRLG